MKQINMFDSKHGETSLERQNYGCEVQDGLVIVDDPYYQNGIIAGYNEVILKTEDELNRFSLSSLKGIRGAFVLSAQRLSYST